MSSDSSQDRRRSAANPPTTPMSSIFRRNSVANPTAFPSGSSSMATPADPRQRRLSITTLGLSGTSPSNTFLFRRSSTSTNSDSVIDEDAIEDDDETPGPSTISAGGAAGRGGASATQFQRRMSLGGQAAMRGFLGGSGSPGADQQGFNWSEQLRSRAESSAGGVRPTFSAGGSSPPKMSSPAVPPPAPKVDLPAPPTQPVRARESGKPDHFGERILKGDFYMD